MKQSGYLTDPAARTSQQGTKHNNTGLEEYKRENRKVNKRRGEERSSYLQRDVKGGSGRSETDDERWNCNDVWSVRPSVCLSF